MSNPVSRYLTYLHLMFTKEHDIRTMNRIFPNKKFQLP